MLTQIEILVIKFDANMLEFRFLLRTNFLRLSIRSVCTEASDLGRLSFVVWYSSFMSTPLLFFSPLAVLSSSSLHDLGRAFGSTAKRTEALDANTPLLRIWPLVAVDEAELWLRLRSLAAAAADADAATRKLSPFFSWASSCCCLCRLR